MWSSNPNPKPLNYSLRIAAVVKKSMVLLQLGYMHLINTTTKVILKHKISIFAVTANFTINEEIYNMVPDRYLKGKLFHWIQHKSMGNFHNTQVALGTLHVHPIGCLVKSDITVNSIMILSDTIKLDLGKFPQFGFIQFPKILSEMMFDLFLLCCHIFLELPQPWHLLSCWFKVSIHLCQLFITETSVVLQCPSNNQLQSMAFAQVLWGTFLPHCTLVVPCVQRS